MVLVRLVESSEIILMKKEPSLFIKEKPLADIKYLGVGFFEWVAVIGVLSMILSAILKNF